MVVYRPLGAGTVSDRTMRYTVTVPPGQLHILVVEKLADWQCLRRCPYTGECLERSCPVRLERVVVRRDGSTYLTAENVPACDRLGYALEGPGSYTIEITVFPAYVIDRIRENPSLVRLAAEVGSVRELGRIFIVPRRPPVEHEARYAAASLYARVGGLRGLQELTGLQGLVLPPFDREVVVLDAPVYSESGGIVRAGPAPAVYATVFSPGDTVNPEWVEERSALTRLGGRVEVCVDGSCTGGDTVVGYWGGGWRVYSARIPPGLHRVRVRLIPADRDRAPDHGVVRGGVTVWDGHMVRGFVAATLFFAGAEPRAWELAREATVCLGETVRARLGRALADLEVEAGGWRGRIPAGSPIEVDVSAAVDTSRLPVEATVKLPVRLTAPGTVVPRLAAPAPATLRGPLRYSEGLGYARADTVMAPDTLPRLEPLSWSGEATLRILSPALGFSARAPDFAEPDSVQEVAAVVSNTGRCRGRFTVRVAAAGRTVERSLWLAPGEEAVVPLQFTMPVGDVEYTVEAALERADGVRQARRASGTVRMKSTVWLHDGVVELRGTDTESTIAVLVAAAFVRPLVEEAGRITVAPGIGASIIVARLKPHETVKVAEYRMLAGVRFRATDKFYLAVGDRLVRRKSEETTYSVIPGLEAALARIPLPL